MQFSTLRNRIKQMKITDFKNYTEYCNYIINNYDRNPDKNREIEKYLFIPKEINCNGVPWKSFTKEEFFAVKFYDWCVMNRIILEQSYQKELSFSELIHEFKQHSHSN